MPGVDLGEYNVEYCGGSAIGQLHLKLGDANQDCFGFEVLKNSSRENVAIVLGVFDGHGDDGHNVSELAKDEVLKRCKASLEEGRTPTDAIRQAFDEVANIVDNLESSRESGSTATVLICDSNEIVVGFVGDSSATYCTVDRDLRRSEARFMFEPHRPSSEREAQRILESGCTIIDQEYVVDSSNQYNVIGLTRAIGDTNMRHCGVHNEPETVCASLPDAASHAVLVIATDGLWDQARASPSEISSLVVRALRSMEDLESALKELLNLNNQLPSDDCTIVVLRISPRGLSFAPPRNT